MTENELTDAVMGLCRERRHSGILAHHCPDSRRCQGAKGFPDVVIAGPGGIIIAELKSRDGETDAPQDLWAWTIHAATMGVTGPAGTRRVRYAVWRPADLASGLIEDEVRSLAS